MGSLFRRPKMPPMPQVELPDESKVPSAEDAAREAAEAEEMRRRNKKLVRSQQKQAYWSRSRSHACTHQ